MATVKMENVKAVAQHDPDDRYGSELVDNEVEETESETEQKERLRGKLHDWWYEGREAAADNRAEQATDEDFVDGIQWSEEDILLLKSRNQEPLVFNEIKPAVEWVIGTEKRSRIDWSVLARNDSETDMAMKKTKLLKYISDVNKAEFHRSRAFGDAVKAGIGWIEIGMRSDPSEEPLFVRRETWRNLWLDPLSVENDISDARFLFRSKILDLDNALVMFPDHQDKLRSASDSLERLSTQVDDDFHDTQLYYSMNHYGTMSVGSSQDYSHGRRRVVRLVECWYKEPARVKVCRCYHERINGQEYDESDTMMVEMVNKGYATVFDAVRQKMRVAIFIDGGEVLQDMASPYKHNRFPFVPIWAYRYARDNQPYSIVRNARDPQKDLNKRRSKALFLMSVNRTVMDKDAVDDLDEYEEEVARPDAIIIKNQGKELSIESNVQLADAHLEYGRENANYIRQASGVTGENMGQETNATSGKAIRARQDQGTVVTASLFDNLRLSQQLMGEIMLSLVEQFYTEEKVIRITGETGVDEFITINKYDEATEQFLDDITKSIGEFKVSEQDHRESVRIAMFEQMMAMLGQLDSETAMQLLDMVFELSDLPGKDELVKRIRKLNGQVDPNDPEAQDEHEQNEQMQAQEAALLKQLEKRTLAANAALAEAKAARETAAADKSKVDVLVQQLEARLKAIDAAMQSLSTPAAAVVAESLMEREKQPQPTSPIEGDIINR